MISIIVPVYNEAENLPHLHEKLMAEAATWPHPMEVIFVNDGSSDRSDEVIDALAATDARVVGIHFRRNFGQTAALMAGIDHARGEFIVPLDADLQNDPADILSMVRKLEQGYDVVSGWRKNRRDHFAHRVLPSKIANWVISRVSGVHLHDYGCSLKAYRADVVRGIRLYGEMHRFVPIYAKWQGARVTEVPVNHHPRRHGQSKYGLERTAKVILDLMVVKFLERYQTKPIYIFGGFGLLSIAIGLGLTALMFYLRFMHGISFILTPLPLAVVMFLLVGVLSTLQGLMAELMTRTYFEAQDKPSYTIRRMVNGSPRNLILTKEAG